MLLDDEYYPTIDDEDVLAPNKPKNGTNELSMSKNSCDIMEAPNDVCASSADNGLRQNIQVLSPHIFLFNVAQLQLLSPIDDQKNFKQL